eukprot:COSAG01_NODE_30090_length_623_cov_0.883588_1_plen_207_part_11
MLGFEVEDEAYVAGLMSNFDKDGNGEVDIWEFKQLWEYIDGDSCLAAEKKEIHEWTVTCERYDATERGGLTREEVSRMVAESGVTASDARLDELWQAMLESPKLRKQITAARTNSSSQEQDGAQEQWLPYELIVQIVRQAAGSTVAGYEANIAALPPQPEPQLSRAPPPPKKKSKKKKKREVPAPPSGPSEVDSVPQHQTQNPKEPS